MKIEKNKNLVSYNTFGINSIAYEFIEIANKEELYDIDYDEFFILGGGSNIILPPILNKKVIYLNFDKIEINKKDEEFVYLKVDAGLNWHKFIEYTLKNNFFGFENLALIPGNVGAAPVQNIGAYGVEQCDLFFELEYFYTQEKQFKTLNKENCNFSYRDSIFKNELKNNAIITNVTYKLSLIPEINISYKDLNLLFQDKINVTPIDVLNAVVQIRKNKLPDYNIIPNTGSFFKNPIISNEDLNKLKNDYANISFFKFGDKIKVSAAWLIENVGMKSYIHNGAKVYEKHSLILTNFKNATQNDVWELSQIIIDKVFQKFSIKLEREVNFIF